MKILYLFLLLALPSVIFAQSNYYKGYVIKNNGDTLKGFINYHEWDQSPKTIDFRINKDDKQTLLFNPKAIKGFEITEMETYISYAGIISMNKMKLDDLPNKLDTSKRQDTIFLRPLATGLYLTLYYINIEF